MNAATAYTAGKILWSFRKELLTVLMVLVLLLLLPVVGTLAIASSGVQQVSDVLAKVNPAERLVKLFDLQGNVYKEFTPQVRWPTDGVVTAEFGVPHEPWERYHTGLDIASRDGKNGQPVYPMMPGKVVGIYDSRDVGLGRHVVIDHGDFITSVYGHLQEFKVSAGDEVGENQVLGLMDSTGYSTGPHVHFMIKVFGIPINPRVFLDTISG